MSDREMLEFAAKAAGAEVIGRRGDVGVYGMPEEISGGVIYKRWNPLTDDGDALRLAVDMRMNIAIRTYPHAVYVEVYNGTVMAVRETLADVRIKNIDQKSATRRAIVRAAAEIGKIMK